MKKAKIISISFESFEKIFKHLEIIPEDAKILSGSNFGQDFIEFRVTSDEYPFVPEGSDMIKNEIHTRHLKIEEKNKKKMNWIIKRNKNANSY